MQNKAILNDTCLKTYQPGIARDEFLWKPHFTLCFTLFPLVCALCALHSALCPLPSALYALPFHFHQ